MASHRRTDLTLKQRYEISTLFTIGVAFHKYITKRNGFPLRRLQVGTSESTIGRHSDSNEKNVTEKVMICMMLMVQII